MKNKPQKKWGRQVIDTASLDYAQRILEWGRTIEGHRLSFETWMEESSVAALDSEPSSSDVVIGRASVPCRRV